MISEKGEGKGGREGGRERERRKRVLGVGPLPAPRPTPTLLPSLQALIQPNPFATLQRGRGQAYQSPLRRSRLIIGRAQHDVVIRMLLSFSIRIVAFRQTLPWNSPPFVKKCLFRRTRSPTFTALPRGCLVESGRRGTTRLWPYITQRNSQLRLHSQPARIAIRFQRPPGRNAISPKRPARLQSPLTTPIRITVLPTTSIPQTSRSRACETTSSAQ